MFVVYSVSKLGRIFWGFRYIHGSEDMRTTPLFAVSAIAAGVLGAVINHDAVVGFPETVPDTTAGSLYLKYKPYLEVYNGCVPFPAVDADGNTGYSSPATVRFAC